MIFAESICKLVVIQHEFLKTCNWEYFDANKKTQKKTDLNAVLSESVHIECYGIFSLILFHNFSQDPLSLSETLNHLLNADSLILTECRTKRRMSIFTPLSQDYLRFNYLINICP